MRLIVRWIFIALTWLLLGGVLWSLRNRERPPTFAVEKIAPPAAGEAPVFTQELLDPGQKLPMVHVASLAELPGGRLAGVWYGGSGECAPDVRLYFATRETNGIWSEPKVMMTRTLAENDLARPLKSLGNAVLLSDPGDSKSPLRLLFVSIAMGKWSGSQLNSCLSEDGGMTWSRAERLTLSPFFNFSELVRNRPIALEGGGWCVPIYQEFLGKFPELLWLHRGEGSWVVQKTRIAGGCSIFQPSLIPLDGTHAIALLRDYTDARRIFITRSDDAGLNWSRPEPTNLPNPDAGISGLRLSTGQLLVAFNDSAKDRSNLTLAISSGEDVQSETFWKKIAVVENEPGASFSYPFLFRSSDGLIHMAYTWKGKAIKMVSFNEAWIIAQEKASSTPSRQ